MVARKNPKASLETILAIGRRVSGEAPIASGPVSGANPPEPKHETDPAGDGTSAVPSNQALNAGQGEAPPQEATEGAWNAHGVDLQAHSAATGPKVSLSQQESVGDFLALAAQARQAKDARQEAVETATCVFSIAVKKSIQEAAADADISVARWVMEAFTWCRAHGITPAQVADAAAWVAGDRNSRIEDEDGSLSPNRAAGSGVPIRASIYKEVVKMAKGVRPRLSNASVLEGCAVIRLHTLKA